MFRSRTTQTCQCKQCYTDAEHGYVKFMKDMLKEKDRDWDQKSWWGAISSDEERERLTDILKDKYVGIVVDKSLGPIHPDKVTCCCFNDTDECCADACGEENCYFEYHTVPSVTDCEIMMRGTDGRASVTPETARKMFDLMNANKTLCSCYDSHTGDSDALDE